MDRINREGDDDKNPLEWTVFCLSLLLVVSILFYLGYEAYTQEAMSPDLVVTYKHDPTPRDPYRYLITVRNKGNETAEQVKVEVVVIKGGNEIDKAEVDLPFAPKESTRQGWVLFKEDPAQADTIEARIVSYKRP